MSYQAELKEAQKTNSKLLENESFNNHLSKLEALDKQIQFDMPAMFTFQNTMESPVKLYTVGFNNYAISDLYFYESDTIKPIIDSLNEMPVYELSSNRIELEHLIECNFNNHISHSRSVHKKVVLNLYLFLLKETKYSFSDLLKLTNSAIDELYNSKRYIVEAIVQIPEMMDIPDSAIRLANKYYKIEGFYNRELVKRACKLTRRHYFIQEVIANKVLRNETVNEFKIGQQIAKKELAKKLTTAEGKIDEVRRIADKESITEEKALEKVNEQALKLIGKKIYKDYNSYRASKSSFFSK